LPGSIFLEKFLTLIINNLSAMKKIFVSAVLLFLSFGAAFGQLSPQSYFSLSYGPSVPVGQYAATGNVNAGGYATPGSVVSFDWAKYYSNFGMTATMSFGSHGVNHNALGTEIGKSGQTPVYTDSSHWMTSCLMIGPAYGIRICEKLTVDFKVVGGLYFAKAPDVRVQNDAGIAEGDNKFNNNIYNCVAALGYQCGASLRYNFCHHFFAKANATFSHARPSYTNSYALPTEANGTIGKHDYSFSQNTSVLDFTLGIGWATGK
jgi:hypothetical protein